VDEARRLAEAAGTADPAQGLRAARALRELAERLEALHVDHARDSGWSWQDIASVLGVSRQAVHKKHSHRAGGDRKAGTHVRATG
jgi:DNA-directed RNA polymerase specialized sigma24 family protein